MCMNRFRQEQQSGGYILSTSHVIMEDVPEENILTLYDVVRRITDYL